MTFLDLVRNDVCLACGVEVKPKSRKYCSRACKAELLDELDFLSPLFHQIKAQSSSFFFSSEWIVLEVQISNPDGVAVFRRAKHNSEKPAKRVHRLAMELNKSWHSAKGDYSAKCDEITSLSDFHEDNEIKPEFCAKPFSYLQIEMEFNEFTFSEELKKAFHRAAKRHHPDHGGSQEKFTALKNEYADALKYPEKFLKKRRYGLQGKWFYDGKRWAPPFK